jgi:polar amino acid transport system permease protein
MEVEEDGEWSLTIKPPLEPGSYTLYAEFRDEDNEPIGRSDAYRIEVPEGALEDEETDPITTPSETPIQIETSTPTVAGTATPGVTVVLYDDFGGNLRRMASHIWNSDGIVLTIRVTFMAFGSALILGLIFGLMRVASRSPNLFEKAGWRLLIGLGLVILLLIVRPAWRNLTSLVWVAVIVEIIMFLLPAMPYTVATLYVEVIRGIPMLVIILYMGFAVTPALRDTIRGWAAIWEPSIGGWAIGPLLVGEWIIQKMAEFDLQGLPAATIGLAFGYGAYLAEIYRAGIESIPRGQMEAARSLGMSYFQAMRHVILPQAIRVVLPPLGNDFIAMLKDSSLISVVALPELLQQGRLWISRNFRAFEGFNSIAMLYLVMTLLLSLLVSFIERRASLPGR